METTDFHPCSLEALSIHDTTLLVVGYYELDENNFTAKQQQTRHGCLDVYKTTASSTNEVAALQLCTRSNVGSGVLDMKCRGSFVAAAESSGAVSLHRVLVASSEAESPVVHMKDNEVLYLPDKNCDHGFALSLDWCGPPSLDEINHLDNSSRIAISTQAGSLKILQLRECGELKEVQTINDAHSMDGETMPVWIVASDANCFTGSGGGYRLVSGGDDCTMRLWDLRSCGSVAIVKNKHDAGVTSAQWHPMYENVFASGSYDEYIRVWDARALKNPLLKVHTGGGVWRTKWICEENNNNSIGGRSVSSIAAACMHAGSCVMQIQVDTGTCEDALTTSSLTHIRTQTQTIEAGSEPLHYGIACLNPAPRASAGGKRTGHYLASCSFYENLITLWSADIGS